MNRASTDRPCLRTRLISENARAISHARFSKIRFPESWIAGRSLALHAKLDAFFRETRKKRDPSTIGNVGSLVLSRECRKLTTLRVCRRNFNGCALPRDNRAPPATNVTCQPLVVHRPPCHRCTRGFIGLKRNKTQLQLHQLQITGSRLAGIVIYLRAVSREPGIE